MTILGIETSCDETSAAVISIDLSTSLISLRSNSIASSLALHAETGGIIPEVAAREQIKCILPVINQALKDALDFHPSQKQPPAIDAIAVTYGPGLIGSLLIGVETAKTLSLLWNKPLIKVNHMYGHIYANFITSSNPKPIAFPALALVVSGGHTDLVLMKHHDEVNVIGGTRDDAAGEAFDKIGRLLNLPYPAGPVIAKLALKGDRKRFPLPRPMLDSHDFDFSFSGLKTAVLNLVKKNNWDFTKNTDEQLLADLCASTQWTIVEVLVRKTLAAAKELKVKSLILGGGVASNTALTETFTQKITENNLPLSLYVPPRSLCTDNAAMIAAAGYFHQETTPWEELTADPQLYY